MAMGQILAFSIEKKEMKWTCIA